MFKKKKKSLFGNNVEINCAHCLRNGAKQGEEPLCTLRLSLNNGKCKKYEYDPLRREPRTSPGLHSDSYGEDDFKL